MEAWSFFARNLELGGFGTVEAAGRQTLVELVDNAEDAVRARVGDEEPSVRIEIRPIGTLPCFSLRIQDNGSGISRADIPLLLGNLFSSRKAGDGSHACEIEDKGVSEGGPAGKFGVGVKLALLAAHRFLYTNESIRLVCPILPGILRVTTSMASEPCIHSLDLRIQSGELEKRSLRLTVDREARAEKPAGFTHGTSVTMVAPGSWDHALLRLVHRLIQQHMWVPSPVRSIRVVGVSEQRWARLRQALPAAACEVGPLALDWRDDTLCLTPDATIPSGDWSTLFGIGPAQVVEAVGRVRSPDHSQRPEWGVKARAALLFRPIEKHASRPTGGNPPEGLAAAAQLLAPDGVDLCVLRYANGVPLMDDAFSCAMLEVLQGDDFPWDEFGLRCGLPSPDDISRARARADEGEFTMDPVQLEGATLLKLHSLVAATSATKQPLHHDDENPGGDSATSASTVEADGEMGHRLFNKCWGERSEWYSCVIAIDAFRLSESHRPLPFTSLRKSALTSTREMEEAVRRVVCDALVELKRKFPLLLLSPTEHAHLRTFQVYAPSDAHSLRHILDWASPEFRSTCFELMGVTTSDQFETEVRELLTGAFHSTTVLALHIAAASSQFHRFTELLHAELHRPDRLSGKRKRNTGDLPRTVKRRRRSKKDEDGR